ncbi:PEGA domain-containing protein [Rosettibacter firmus]|uniref:PEGA domain-containing protein n=1 Tax=Rosettibacter firmus TaxID=3111522 RepID=UPI00336BAEDB
MKNKIKISLLFLLFIIITSCKEFIDDGVGPCVHVYKEAIFHISELKDSASNNPISFAKIVSLKINGEKQIGLPLGDKNYGIVYFDSVYYCNFPCGFGIESGTYEFKIVAEGYKDKVVKFENVDYSIKKGGCPSYSDGGKRVSVIMSKK